MPVASPSSNSCVLGLPLLPPQNKKSLLATALRSQHAAEHLSHLLSGPKHDVNVPGLPLRVTRQHWCLKNSCFPRDGLRQRALGFFPA